MGIQLKKCIDCGLVKRIGRTKSRCKDCRSGGFTNKKVNDQITVEQFRVLVEDHGLYAHECARNHWKILGGRRTINFFTNKKGYYTIHIQFERSSIRGSVLDAIELAKCKEIPASYYVSRGRIQSEDDKEFNKREAAKASVGVDRTGEEPPF